MQFTTLSCPQCGGPLPRQAHWRMVTCPFCSAEVTRSQDVVQAATFHDAWLRARSAIRPAERCIASGVLSYRVLARLGAGELADVFLAERMDCLPERVVIKLARPDAPASALSREDEVLRTLQALQIPGAAYYSRRLPQPVALGSARLDHGPERPALVLRHPPGLWGSLADALSFHPAGLDPRHAVWIWRRVLDLLAFIHAAGWTHGDLRAMHWQVQPRDHGILLTGWRHARARATHREIARDLMQSAWTLRQLLCGTGHDGDAPPGLGPATPQPLSRLLRQASEEPDWCSRQGAAGLDQALQDAALQSFGAPRFVPFNPTGSIPTPQPNPD